MSQLMSEINRTGLPPARSASSVARARGDVAAMCSVYGPLKRMHTFSSVKGDRQLPIQSPIAMLSYAVTHSSAFVEYVKTAIYMYPPSADNPWHIIAYCDEIVCGNPLANIVKRKMQNVYIGLWRSSDLKLCATNFVGSKRYVIPPTWSKSCKAG